jgi:hypothetical protein
MNKSLFRRGNSPWEETAPPARCGSRRPHRDEAWRCAMQAPSARAQAPGPSGPAGLTICKQIRHLPFRETIGTPGVSQVGAPVAAILQSARTMQQIMNANVRERRLRINLKCLYQLTTRGLPLLRTAPEIVQPTRQSLVACSVGRMNEVLVVAAVWSRGYAETGAVGIDSARDARIRATTRYPSICFAKKFSSDEAYRRFGQPPSAAARPDQDPR